LQGEYLSGRPRLAFAGLLDFDFDLDGIFLFSFYTTRK
jgi:hypothetical protein